MTTARLVVHAAVVVVATTVTMSALEYVLEYDDGDDDDDDDDRHMTMHQKRCMETETEMAWLPCSGGACAAARRNAVVDSPYI